MFLAVHERTSSVVKIYNEFLSDRQIQLCDRIMRTIQGASFYLNYCLQGTSY